MRGWKTLSVVLVLLFTASTSFAAGFRLVEGGVKAMGMGFAFTAVADDPSAIYFNPAGLTQLKGQNVMLGGTFVRENGAEFTGSTPLTGGVSTKETQKSLNFIIPNAYYTRTNASTGFSYGVGVFSPFGLGQEYNNKGISIFRNQVTKIDLKTVVVNPTVAFKVNEFLSVGAGIDYMYGMVKYDKIGVVPSTAPYGGPGQFNAALDGNGDAWGYNFGVLLKPTQNLKIGFNYRSPFHLTLKDGDFTAGPLAGTANPAIFPMGATKASGKLELPATAALGVAYTLDRLTLTADADWTFWSSYQSLKITNGSVATYNVNNQKQWKDVCALRFGAEYRVTDPLALRAGFVYDPTPAPADTMGPELPDSTRMNYMLGAGYKIGPWTIDVAGMYIDKFDRTVSNMTLAGNGFNGKWTGNAWLAGVDVGYKF